MANRPIRHWVVRYYDLEYHRQVEHGFTCLAEAKRLWAQLKIKELTRDGVCNVEAPKFNPT